MKELDNFTVERLEEIRNSFLDRIQESAPSIGEVFALIDIALAAKRAEPVAWEVKGYLCHSKEKADSYVGEPVPLYEVPRLNSPEVSDGWKLVPIEPTQNMVDAHISGMQLAGFSRAYRDMLAAAPEPQNQQQNIPENIPQGWTSSDPANAALVMLDRIDTMDSADDDRIEDIKLIIRQLAAEPEKGNG